LKRIAVDTGLLILFLLVMSVQFLPKIWHEILGVFMLIVLFVHLFFNRRWFTALTKFTWNARQIISGILNILLIADFSVAFVTGMIISNYLFKGWFGDASMSVYQIHISSSYVLLILFGLHLGLHWQGVWQRISYKLNIKGEQILTYMFVFAVIIAGIYGSFVHRVADHIQMIHMFGTPATKLSWTMFLLSLASIPGLYTVIGFAVNKALTHYNA